MKESKESRELIYLAGEGFDLGFGKIYPLTLREIVKIGYDKYNKYLGMLAIDKDNYIENLGLDGEKKKELEQLSNFEFVFVNCLHNEDFRKEYMEAIEVFFREPVQFYEQGFFYFGEFEELKDELEKGSGKERLIHKGNFDDVQLVVKEMNGVKVGKKKEEMDEFDRRVMEAEKMLSKYENKDEGISLITMISSLANMDDNDLNIINIWDLTIYQLYDQFKRGQLKEKYFIDIKSLLAGAKKEDVNLEHYIKNFN